MLQGKRSLHGWIRILLSPTDLQSRVPLAKRVNIGTKMP